MNKTICVFSSSSNTIDHIYFEAASNLGREIARRGDQFLFGGGLTGLMGECARSVHRHGGMVIGVIPEALNETGIVYESCDELVVTNDMRTRKATMDERSDAFIALPGGFGTIEEVMEIITLKQLRYHTKPIIILNIGGYYDSLLSQLERTVEENFAKEACLDLFFVTDNITAALDHIDAYIPTVSGERWLTDVDRTASIPVGEACVSRTEYCKLEIFIPTTHLSLLQDALRHTDAGHIGSYDRCLSYTETTGCWRPLPGSTPYDGKENVMASGMEYKVEVLCLKHKVDETIRNVKEIHPYEVPVINVIPVYKTGL